MTSIRQNKISRLLQREMSELLQKESALIAPGAMITVTVVRVTPDFSIARFYLSIFATKDKPEEVLDAVREHTSTLRKSLGDKVRHQLRKIPELEFYLDDSLDYASRIDELLKK